MSGRGRTKKPKEVKDTKEAACEDTGVAGESVVGKKTKKKQFPVVAVITPEGIEGNLLSTTKRPLVVHLPIQSKDVPMNDMPITYNPMPPMDAQPYDSACVDPFHEEREICSPLLATVSSLPSDACTSTTSGSVLSSSSSRAPISGTTASGSAKEEMDFYRMKGTFLVQFKGASDVKTLPATSDAACFWCCHTFDHRPVVLPIRDTGEHLLVMGNFCCPECAYAYLFDMRQDAHTRWEQQALLYRVYGAACGGDIYPAPHRTLLKMFGGTLSIEQYRQLIRSHKVRVDIHLPPMVSILSTMDTKPIDFYDASLTKNVNETVTERLQKAEEVLRLRRTKPLKAWESTLDACINLKIKYEGTTLSLDS